MIKIGQVQSLKVFKKIETGFILTQDNGAQEDEVFLPEEFSDSRVQVGESLDVFVYKDTNQEGLNGSLQEPLAQVDQYAFLRVKEIHEFGSFLELGIEKDLLVPANEQKEKFGSHGRKLVRLCLEEGTDRLFGTTKFGVHLQSQIVDLDAGDRVQLQPTEKTTLGYRCIVNKSYIGMIYHNEIFENIEIGEFYSGVLKLEREDGFLDIALQTQGVGNLFESRDRVLNFLRENGGESYLNDKSKPEEIKRLLGMSKKTFKSAIGMLYKDREIIISKEGIKLI